MSVAAAGAGVYDILSENMSDFDAKILSIVNRAVRAAQDENRRRGIPNVYCINGTIVWQLPDGTVTMKNPDA